MEDEIRKEQFSHAYVRAVASAAGCVVGLFGVDHDSVDLSLRSQDTFGPISSPQLDLQIKCTARIVPIEDEIRFPLKIKNYNDLRRENLLVPRILVLVLVPQHVGAWLSQSEEEMRVRHCAYWLSLRGLPEKPNDYSVTVRVPRSNIFDVPALESLMRRVSAGENP